MKTIITALVVTVLVGALAVVGFEVWRNQEMEVSGQVFIVRKDRETVKLSGVNVMAGGAKLRTEAMRVKEEIARLSRECNARLKAATDRFDAATKAEEEAKTAWERGQRRVRDLKKAIQVNAEAMAYSNEGQRLALAAENRKINERGLKVEAEVQGLATAYKAAKEEMEEADKQATAALAESKTLATRRAALVYDPALTGERETLTDADGRFCIKVPKHSESVLLVRTEREVLLNGKEYYLWAEPVKGTNMLLSNVNLLVGVTE